MTFNLIEDALPEVKEIGSTRPLARTEHRCTVCGLPIAIGTRYQKTTIYDRNALKKRDRIRNIRWHLPHCPEDSQ